MHYRSQWALLKICTSTKHELSNLAYKIVLALLRGWADHHDLRLLWRLFAKSSHGLKYISERFNQEAFGR